MKTTDANLERHIRSLASAWFALPGASVNYEEHDENVFLNCMGYTTAAVECAIAYLDIDTANRIPRGIVARSLYELGITCVWLSLQGRPGLDALAYESARQRRALALEFVDSTNVQLQESARRKAQTLPPKPALADEVRNIDRMMAALDAGDTPLYGIYRLYSGYAHASLDVANSYIVQGEDGEIHVQIPGPHSALNDHLGTAVAPLVWAVTVANEMLQGKPLSSKLETLRLQLGTSTEFRLKASTTSGPSRPDVAGQSGPSQPTGS